MARLSWLLLLVAAVGVSSFGTQVSIEEVPYAATVEIGLLGTWVQQCAGAIITNYHIVSNAYCFFGIYDFSSRRVRVGTSNRQSGGDVLYVQFAYLHPYFGQLGKDGDLSVVRLSSHLNLGPKINSIFILGQGIDLPSGLALTNVGWGTTVQGGTLPNNQLYKSTLFVHNTDRCLERFQTVNQIVTENMLCAGRTFTQGRDFDPRDVGAPLVYQNTLVGILSFGESNGDSFPVVATHIGYFSDWIVAIAVD